MVPVMVTLLPPDSGPIAGLSDATAGAGARKAKWSAAHRPDVPPVVVTVMSTVPGAEAGAVATTWVAESEVMLPVAEPKETEVAPASGTEATHVYNPCQFIGGP